MKKMTRVMLTAAFIIAAIAMPLVLTSDTAAKTDIYGVYATYFSAGGKTGVVLTYSQNPPSECGEGSMDGRIYCFPTDFWTLYPAVIKDVCNEAKGGGQVFGQPVIIAFGELPEKCK